MFTLETVVISLGTALVMSMSQFVAKMKTGEAFDLKKLGRTMAAGLGAGLVSWLTGNEPTLDTPSTIAATGGLTGIFDVVSKLGWRLFSRKNVSPE